MYILQTYHKSFILWVSLHDCFIPFLRFSLIYVHLFLLNVFFTTFPRLVAKVWIRAIFSVMCDVEFLFYDANPTHPPEIVLLTNVLEYDKMYKYLLTFSMCNNHPFPCKTQEWNDYNLKWNDSEYGGVKDLRITPNKLWRPDVLMYNRSVLSLALWSLTLKSEQTAIL